MATANLTLERLTQLLHYKPETGLFTRVRPCGGAVVGAVAGNRDPINFYVRIGVDGVSFRAHRLAWLYMIGTWPTAQIDHINGVRDDNRWLNLRAATLQQNNQHVHAPRADSTSGRRGVSWFALRGVWRASIAHAGRQVHLGYFADPDAAQAAYKAAKIRLHPFSHCEVSES